MGAEEGGKSMGADILGKGYGRRGMWAGILGKGHVHNCDSGIGERSKCLKFSLLFKNEIFVEIFMVISFASKYDQIFLG